MSMRVRDLQQYLEKFTMGVKGTGVSDAHVYIETQDGHLEEIRKMEVQDSKLLKASEPIRWILNKFFSLKLLKDGQHLRLNRVKRFQGTGVKARVDTPQQRKEKHG